MNGLERRCLLLIWFLFGVSLSGCGRAAPATTVARAPTSASASFTPPAPTRATTTATSALPIATTIPPTATPLPPSATPTVHPTSTSVVPHPTASLSTPQSISPSRVYVGSLSITSANAEGDKPSSGAISLVTSADGAIIHSIGFTLTNVSCDAPSSQGRTRLSVGSLTVTQSGPFSISGDRFTAALGDGGELNGQLVSPTEATGTLHYIYRSPGFGGSASIRCDMGTWPWRAVSNSPSSSSGALAPPSATGIPRPEAVVLVDLLSLREGPGLGFPTLAGVRIGTRLLVIGQSNACAWLNVIPDSGPPAWVSGDPQYVKLTSICTALPVSFPRPPTGVIKRYVTGGWGELTVENGSGKDGVIILTRLNDQPLLAAYIRAAGSLLIDGIPDGVYRIYFSQGEAWDSERNQFARDVSLQRFEDTLDFTTTGRQYTSWKITLHAVPGGNAGAEHVDPSQYPSIQ